MKKIFTIFPTVLMTCLFVNKAYGTAIEKEFSFNTNELIQEEVEKESVTYDLLTLKNSAFTRNIGEPQLPVKSVYFILPPDPYRTAESRNHEPQ